MLESPVYLYQIVTMSYILDFCDMNQGDISKVGGKNASLGEMIQKLSPSGIIVPGGFVLTVDAYRLFIQHNRLQEALQNKLDKLDRNGLSNLDETGEFCRQLIYQADLPDVLKKQISDAYKKLDAGTGEDAVVAVRSSATAEDLPGASFAGQHDSFLNIHGEEQVYNAVIKCYASLFNDRAIKYRMDHGFGDMEVGLSVGVQYMVRSDIGSAGVAFTIEPENGHENIIYITACWGLGENIVQGAVSPDEFYVFKPSVLTGKPAIIQKKPGAKETKMVYDDAPTMMVPVKRIPTTAFEKAHFSISTEDVEQLATWCLNIENHYKCPMDIEWAKDGQTGQLFIVQARPETIHAGKKSPVIKEYECKPDALPVCTGKSVGRGICAGPARVIQSLADAHKVKEGDIIVADITNPDWNALLKKARSIVTNKGGRTSHASIVARELGIHAVVGTGDATVKIADGQIITVSCTEGDSGKIYTGKLTWKEHLIELADIPKTNTKPMLILADPEKAFYLSGMPNEGVGLLRMEFIISNSIRIHPMALVHYDTLPESNDKTAIKNITAAYSDKKKYFVEKLSESLAIVAAAFYPKDVIVRMSDFKTNEYALLIGGKDFEPHEENPMLGFRGASRYYHEKYRDGFGLECEAIKKVRDEMSLTNIKVMIPFCRTVEEGKKVLDVMKSFGLERSVNGLEVYVMAEIPSNVILAAGFAQIFDGFSIGSNDLTQLTLGIDRDSVIISDLFDENNEAVLSMLKQVISVANREGKKIGLCGQAPSDYPGFARILVDAGIHSISFVPDALIKGIQNIHEAEKNLPGKQNPKNQIFTFTY